MNYGEFKKFLETIENNELIDEEKKQALIDYLHNYLLKRVFFFNGDFEDFEKLLKEFDYDVNKISKFLDMSYEIRDAINKNKENRRMPTVEYLRHVKKLVDELGIDYQIYDSTGVTDNVLLSRIIYRSLNNKLLLNDEISIIDLTKKIKKLYSEEYDNNSTIIKILRTLDMIDRGLQNIENKEKVFSSEEIEMLYQHVYAVNHLHLIEIVDKFYPFFGNELFVLISQAIEEKDVYIIETNEIIKYLIGKQAKQKMKANTIRTISQGIEKIDLNTKRQVSDVFDELLESIKKNNLIGDETKENLLKNIAEIYSMYVNEEQTYLSEELKGFFTNCEYYINNLIIPSSGKKEWIDKLINVCLNNCKSFFMEYDGKKFKSIVDYLINNTGVGTENLSEIAKKCSNIFKDADIEKLTHINKSLKEFRDFINKTFDNKNEFIADNLFDSIIVNKPELLINNNDLNNVLKFLKGELSLKDYGYQSADFRLNKEILNFEFYKNIVLNDYDILFNASIDRIASNLNHIENICHTCNINFRELKINQDMIYTLLKEDLYNNDTYCFARLNSVFSNTDLKKILEYNPHLLLIDEEEISVLIEKCLLNENEEYSFYDLFSSELYKYNKINFKNKSKEEILNNNFKYINLNLDLHVNLGAYDLLTCGIIPDENANKIWDEYMVKIAEKERLEKLIIKLETEKLSIDELYELAKEAYTLYDKLYSGVPCITIKNRLRDVINDNIEHYQFKIDDSKSALELEREYLSIYEEERDEGYTVQKELNNLLNRINSEILKADIDEFVKDKISKRVKDNDIKVKDTADKIEKIVETVKLLERKVSNLEYILDLEDSQTLEYDIEEERKWQDHFTINGLNFLRGSLAGSDVERIQKKLNGKNIVLFSRSIDLEDVPNDKIFLDKINKFIGDTDYSILSQSFMKNNSSNRHLVEKYTYRREGIWSRRENETTVRAYFIPIHTKYFSCYYVFELDIADGNNHLDAGCSTDSVYNQRINEAKVLEEKINNLSSIEEVIEFIEKSQRKYQETMKPIISKLNVNNKNKK